MSRCPTCERPMVALLLSLACDYCEYGPRETELYRGFCVMRPCAKVGQMHYVFKTRIDAESWQNVISRRDSVVTEVWSLRQFEWVREQARDVNVSVADHLVEIFPDHRYAAKGHRAFVRSSRADVARAS